MDFAVTILTKSPIQPNISAKVCKYKNSRRKCFHRNKKVDYATYLFLRSASVALFISKSEKNVKCESFQ